MHAVKGGLRLASVAALFAQWRRLSEVMQSKSHERASCWGIPSELECVPQSPIVNRYFESFGHLRDCLISIFSQAGEAGAAAGVAD